MKIVTRLVLAGGAAVLTGLTYFVNYKIVGALEERSVARRYQLEQQLENQRSAIWTYVSETPASDERLRNMAGLYMDVLRTKRQIEYENFDINFWRKAKHNPVKTVNMLIGGIYPDLDLLR